MKGEEALNNNYRGNEKENQTWNKCKLPAVYGLSKILVLRALGLLS